MPDKRLGRPLCFPCRCLLGGQRLFARTWGAACGFAWGWPGPAGGAAAFGGPPGRQTKGRRGQRPLRPLCALRAPAAPPAGPGQCSPTGGRPHRFYQTKQRAAQRVARRRGAGGLANGAHGGAEGHQRQLCQLKVLFPPGDADDGDAPQAAKHKGFDSQGQAADQQPDDVGQ